MAARLPITGQSVTRSGITCMGRLLGQAGVPITQASISAITFTVRDLTNATTITSAQSVTVSAAVFDALQTSTLDPRWDKDDANHLGPDGRHGYNFRHIVQASFFTNFDVGSAAPFAVVDHRFRVDFVFVPIIGQQFVVPFETTALASWIV